LSMLVADTLEILMRRKRSHSAMVRALLAVVALGALGASTFSFAQTGLWDDRGGLGLRQSYGESSAASARSPANHSLRNQPSASPDYKLYSGMRELPRLGAPASESYGGVEFSISRKWGSSLEVGVTPETAAAPRRYSLGGRLQTTLSGDSGVSLGLKYRQYESGSALRGGRYVGDPAGPIRGDELTPGVTPGLYSGPSYEVRLRYRYSPSSTFGLALGRDLESSMPGLDPAYNGERQLMFSGQHWLTPSWGLSYDLLSDDPGGSLRMQGLRLGVRYRF
jgi:hypothetical protein